VLIGVRDFAHHPSVLLRGLNRLDLEFDPNQDASARPDADGWRSRAW
jgi:hypothetical protein